MPKVQLRLPDTLRLKLTRYRFEISHIIALFTILISFQIILALFQKSLLSDFLKETQSWFQKYYAERLAIVTSTNIELLFENQQRLRTRDDDGDQSIIYSLNVIYKQQLIQRSVEDISLILVKNHQLYVIDNGQKLFDYFRDNVQPYQVGTDTKHNSGIQYFLKKKEYIKENEKILSFLTNEKTFDVLVPFVPDGEYIGVLYMRITPEFEFLTSEVQANFDKASIIFSALIFVGLIIIFIVSSRAVNERNEAQERLFVEHEQNLEKQIQLEKESLFTKRIYHTHHKAEKIMGFIKNDVRTMKNENLDDLKKRVIAYSNFISRIIYDMKWYDQDINTIINPIFKTNINTVIKFIVDNVFLRISSANEMFKFELILDPAVPVVHVNEFIIWEIFEPLIQNSIDHGGKDKISILLTTKYDASTNRSYVYIQDDGQGIKSELMETDEKGVKKVFLEKEETHRHNGSHSGYGCYIAYQMAVGKCGWSLDVNNLTQGGSCFTIMINN
jgi:hypothetical protein